MKHTKKQGVEGLGFSGQSETPAPPYHPPAESATNMPQEVNDASIQWWCLTCKNKGLLSIARGVIPSDVKISPDLHRVPHFEIQVSDSECNVDDYLAFYHPSGHVRGLGDKGFKFRVQGVQGSEVFL